MPVKWDARTDQILLLKILETSHVSADVKAISDAWPTSEAEKPTPRAITERLGKIRKDVKGGTGSFKVSGQKAATMTSDVTPQKRAPRGSKSGFASASAKKSNGGSSGSKALNGNGKRARNDDDEYAPSPPLSICLPLLLTPPSPSLLTTNGDGNDRMLSLPPVDPFADEDARNVPASQELYGMLIHYGVITTRDDDAAADDDDGDDRSQTLVDGVAEDDEQQTATKTKAKKTALTNGGHVKIEEELGNGWSGGMGGDNHHEYGFTGFGGDGAGDDGANGLIFA